MPKAKIEVESGVAIPPKGGRPKFHYPWNTMEVGDSFFVAGRTHANFSAMVARAKKITGFDFTCRAVDGGLRIWRTE